MAHLPWRGGQILRYPWKPHPPHAHAFVQSSPLVWMASVASPEPVHCAEAVGCHSQDYVL